MARFVLENPAITVDGVDLSRRVREVEVNSERDEVDATCAQGGGEETLPGLRKATIKVKWAQDFDAAMVDATLWPIHDNAEEVEITVAGPEPTVSETNPRWVAQGTLPKYTPLSGAIGALVEVETEFKVNGRITRETT